MFLSATMSGQKKMQPKPMQTVLKTEFASGIKE